MGERGVWEGFEGLGWVCWEGEGVVVVGVYEELRGWGCVGVGLVGLWGGMLVLGVVVVVVLGVIVVVVIVSSCGGCCCYFIGLEFLVLVYVGLVEGVGLEVGVGVKMLGSYGSYYWYEFLEWFIVNIWRKFFLSVFRWFLILIFW